MFQYRLPTKGQAQRTDGKTICHRVDSLWLPSCPWLPAIPTRLPHWATLGDWQQGCTGTGLQHHPNPWLWEGRSQQRLLRPNLPCYPGIQLHTQPQATTQKWDTRGTCRCYKAQSMSQSLSSSTGFVECASGLPEFYTDLGMQLSGLRRLSGYIIHHSLHCSKHLFKSIYMLRKHRTVVVVLNGLILLKVPGIFNFYFLSLINLAPNVESCYIKVNSCKSFKSPKSFQRYSVTKAAKMRETTQQWQDEGLGTYERELSWI